MVSFAAIDEFYAQKAGCTLWQFFTLLHAWMPSRDCMEIPGLYKQSLSSFCNITVRRVDTTATSGSLRAGSLDEREPARIPITFTCMRPIFGRRALIG
jgi:hypothetical protein